MLPRSYRASKIASHPPLITIPLVEFNIIAYMSDGNSSQVLPKVQLVMKELTRK